MSVISKDARNLEMAVPGPWASAGSRGVFWLTAVQFLADWADASPHARRICRSEEETKELIK
jgi:hypothetical protein